LKFKSEQSSIIVQYERRLQYYTAVWIHVNEHFNSSFSSSQHKYTQLDTSETSSHNVIN